MATKPTVLFDIATNDNYDTGPRTGEATKLPIADVGNGLTPGTPVTPEQINYPLHYTGKWLQWLDDLANHDLLWTVDQTFGKAVTLGQSMITEAFALLPRILIPLFVGAGAAVSDKVNVLEVVLVGTKVGIWVDRVPTLIFVANASWDNATDLWSKHTAGIDAHILRMSVAGPVLAVKASTEDAAWSDTLDAPTGWTKSLLTYATGALTIQTLIATTLSSGFAGAISVLSQLSWPATVSVTLARLLFARHATEDRTPISSFANGGYKIHVYYSLAEGLEVAFNALWAPSTDVWSADGNTATPAVLFQFSKTGLNVLRRITPTGTWAHAAWAQAWPIVDVDNGLTFPRLLVDTLRGYLNDQISVEQPLLFPFGAFDSDEARLVVEHDNDSAQFTFVCDIPNIAVGAEANQVKVYRFDIGYAVAFNCEWSESALKWNAISTAQTASLWVNRRGIFEVYRKVTTTTPWTHNSAGWADGFPSLRLDGSDKNPNPATGFTNTVTPKNTAKAIAKLTNTAGTIAIIFDGSTNIASATAISSTEIEVTFTDPMGSANYVIFPLMTRSSIGGVPIIARVSLRVSVGQTASVFAFDLIGDSGVIDLTTAGLFIEMSIMVMGAQ
jgi:hypothetical protein